MDERATCAELSRFLCQHLCDAAAVDLLPEDTTAARPPAQGPALQRAASAGLVKVRYLPSGTSALVGGDWFETVRLHYGRTLLVMGDVMGHGLDAAVDMNAYRSTLRYVASTDLPPHRVLRQLDTAVAEDEARRPATCLLARVDPARGIAGFASAGHLPPVVFGRDGTAELMRLPVGPPLGTGIGGYELVTRTLSTRDRSGRTPSCSAPLPGVPSAAPE